MAMMMLIWKSDPKAKEPLEKMVKESKNALARMQALCMLGIEGSISPELLLAALKDAEPAVRQHAIRLTKLSRLREWEQLAQLTDLFSAAAVDADPGVRFQFAYGIADFEPSTVASRFAVELWRKDADRYLSSALISSLHLHNIVGFAEHFIGRSGKDGPPPSIMHDILATAAGINDGSSLPGILQLSMKSDGGMFKPWQLAASTGALDSLERHGKSWDKFTPEVLKPIKPVVAFARKLVEKDDAAEADLLAALPLLGRDPVTLEDDLKRLSSLLAASRPAAVQSAVITALARTPDKSVPTSLIGAWANASPFLRSRILDALLNRAVWHVELLAAVEKGTIPAGQIDAARRQRLVGSTDKVVRAKAEKLFAGGTNADRQKVINEYKAALALAGDKVRGKAVFAKSCSACHLLDGVGHAVGPDLATLANKSTNYLLSEVFDPNRNLDSRYAEYQAITKDERTISGVLATETASAITIRGQQGKEETILRADILTLRGSGKSLMPEGLEKEITRQDAADLFAYLTANDPPHKKLPGNNPVEVVLSANALTLPATRCFVFGGSITFEVEFWNIGYWHDERDFVVWKVKLDKPAEFDVYLDYACANDSAGNPFAIEGVAPVIRGKVVGTGGWDRYTLQNLGKVKLPAGAGRVTFRPDGPLKGALLDLRTLYLVPVGTQPKTEGHSATEIGCRGRESAA